MLNSNYPMFQYYGFEMPDDYTVVDTETTGLGNYDKIIEIAAARVRNGKIVDSFQQLLNPGMPISPGASKVNGITNAMVKNCPPFSSIKDGFLSFIGSDPIVGHNVTFDLRFINNELGYGISNQYIDTLSLSRSYVDETEDHKLITLVRHFGLAEKQTHRALGDVELTQMLFEKIKTLILDEKLENVDETLQYMSLKEVAKLLLRFNSILQEYDQKIIDYLIGQIKFKKNLIESAPSIPQNVESSILLLFKKDKALDEASFKRLYSIAKARLKEYKMREVLISRIEAKTRTIKEPYDSWQEEYRNEAYESLIMKRAQEKRIEL